MTEEGGFPAVTVGVCVLLIGSLLAGFAAAPAAGQDRDLLTIDGDHDLTSDQTMAEFEATGNVSTNVPQADLRVQVAKNHDAVGLDGVWVDATNTYLRIDYDEEIPREIRIHIPADYFAPRPKEPLEAYDSGHTAALAPVKGATAVSMTLDGPTDTVFVVNREQGAVFSARRFVQEKVENGTGWSIPSLSSTAEWDYIASDDYGPNTTATLPLNDSLTMQYRHVTDDGTERWIPVPDCEDPSTQAVCTYPTGNQTRIVTAQADPPRVRYRYQRTLLGDLEGVANDLAAIPDRIQNWVDGVFG